MSTNSYLHHHQQSHQTYTSNIPSDHIMSFFNIIVAIATSTAFTVYATLIFMLSFTVALILSPLSVHHLFMR